MVAWPCSAWPPGSSPRPWGTRMTEPRTPTRTRFIPTPVGNTSGSTSTRSTSSVHPHARGEHAMRKHAQPSRGGSSPRPWGTRGRLATARRGCRFIPTPVGNTRMRWMPQWMRPVHPHARGEHPQAGEHQSVSLGSSPRPWGTHQRSLESPVFPRFIPTPVGNTSRRRASVGGLAVHPHARGEHVWEVDLLNHSVRFIPTPVGNTQQRRLARRVDAVHPHARGEHVSAVGDERSLHGSSPRPWGTRGSGP